MTFHLNSVSAPRRGSLHEELAVSLREIIVNGELTPGTKVPEKDLCEAFGVSRTPLREALKVLAAEGLVILEPNRGAWVSPITVEDLEEVFPVMGALEALSGELACERITDAEIAEIRRLHALMVEAHRTRDMPGYFAVNQEIHEAILAAAHNHTLSVQYRSLATRVRRARFVANMTQERWDQATAEHEEMLLCLERRDGPALAEVLKRHLANKLHTVRAWLLAMPEEQGQSRDGTSATR
jgi:DNA-binding GntR family transcriptional regulator